MVYVSPTIRFMAPPAGIEAPFSFTFEIELRLWEIRRSTYSSRGLGVEIPPAVM